MPRFIVTLTSPRDLPPADVILATNANGELPAVLINPTDVTGSRVRGMWLQDVAEQARYEWAPGSGWYA